MALSAADIRRIEAIRLMDAVPASDDAGKRRILVDLIAANMREVEATFRDDLDRALFATDPFHAALPQYAPLTGWARRMAQVRAYLSNWGLALSACGRALRGRDVWPDDED